VAELLLARIEDNARVPRRIVVQPSLSVRRSTSSAQPTSWEHKPSEWAATIAEASRTDLELPGRVMASVAQELHEADARRWAQRTETLERLAS
jgi:hypothetical protein